MNRTGKCKMCGAQIYGKRPETCSDACRKQWSRLPAEQKRDKTIVWLREEKQIDIERARNRAIWQIKLITLIESRNPDIKAEAQTALKAIKDLLNSIEV